ncbi:MAG: hypothetical protein ACK54C_08860 [Betaproteobacteria bacterium]
MKRIPITVLTLAALCAAGSVAAQEGKAPSKPAAPPTACCVDAKAQMAQMNEHLTRMRALHDKFAKASTPEERQTLMDEQHREMKQGMDLMDKMRHDGAMMGGGMAMDCKGKPADQAMQMQMMQARMDMMQAMMHTMLDQQTAAGGATVPAPAK